MSKATFYVGQERDKDGKPLKRLRVFTARNKSFKRLVDLFDGYTANETFGGWLGSDGKIVQEKGLRLEVFGATQNEATMVARFIAEQFNQSAVLMDFEGRNRRVTRYVTQ